MESDAKEISPVIPSATAATPAKRRGKRRIALLLVIAIILVGVGLLVWPWFRNSLGHVSTDDAIVNGHVTYVAPRISGHVEAVLVDDNQFVQKGDLLVRIDRQPLEIGVQQKKAALAEAKVSIDQQVAALEVARAELDQAHSQARGQIAGLRGAFDLLLAVQDVVRYELQGLQSGLANLKLQQANEKYAEVQVKDAQTLPAGALSAEDRAQREANLDVQRQQVAVALQSIQQTRALLGLPLDTQNPGNVPADVGQTFAGAQYAKASAEQALANLGITFDLGGLSQANLLQKISGLATEAMVAETPGVRTAQARVNQALAALGGKAFDPQNPYDHPSVLRAQKDLEDAELQLSYTEITAPITGFISRRNVSPGTQVDIGQGLMAIRPLDDVWVDANFKETQLGDLRIGQSVDIHVDAYPGKVFHGRVAGFSPGTGAVLSLLPPENATGNFVKVVQRLPVRIDLTDALSMQTPLFTGLSVEPEVDIHSNPTGPDAGQRLRTVTPSMAAASR